MAICTFYGRSITLHHFDALVRTMFGYTGQVLAASINQAHSLPNDRNVSVTVSSVEDDDGRLPLQSGMSATGLC